MSCAGGITIADCELSPPSGGGCQPSRTTCDRALIAETAAAGRPVSRPVQRPSRRRGHAIHSSINQSAIVSCSREPRSAREPSVRDGSWLTRRRRLRREASPRATRRFSASSRRPRSSRPISGSSTTSLAGIQDSEVPGGSGNPAYTEAVAVLDEDMAQYIHDNTDDEISHCHVHQRLPEGARAEPVNLDQVPHPAEQQGDRCAADRPADEPDAADGRHQLGGRATAATDRTPTSATRSRRPFPGWPQGSSRRSRAPTPTSQPDDHLQAIANTAGFHFAFIEQGGTSLYAALAQRVTHRRGAPHPAQHRPDRDDALPDLAGQGRQRAAAHRPDQRSRVPGSERPAAS